jgi:hypothetical protein
MAELQTHTDAGEMTQRFIEFVMMQAQNAALFLGQIPNPRGGEPEINLDVAKMFIDQLAMIRAKTKGNLSDEELAVINNAISNLQMTFYEVSQGRGKTGAEPERKAAEPVADSATPASAETDAPSVESPADEAGSRKKFSKSYGAA